MKHVKTQQQLNEDKKLNLSGVSDSYSCKDCKMSDNAEDVDELSKVVIKHLNDWKKGKYNRNSKYIWELASNLQKIDVLFSRDIEKE